MKKEFLVNIVLLIIINFIVKISYLFFIEVEIQNTIGPEQYGLFLALFNFSYLLQFINDPGIQSYNSTFIASGETKINTHISRVIGLKILLSIIFIIGVLSAAYIIGYRSQDIRLLLFMIAVNQVLSTGFMFLRSNLSALGYYRLDTYISALDKLLMIIILGYFLVNYGGSLTLFHFVGGQMLAFLIACITALLLLAGRKIRVIPSFSKSYSLSILKGAAPFALILLLMASYNKMDGVMLERLLEDGAYHAGIYAASLRFMDAANMGAYLMAALLLPMFASQHKDNASLGQLSELAIRMMMVLVTVVCVVGITFREELMSIYDVYDSQYNRLLILHLLSFGCVGISYVYGTLLTATKKLKQMNYILVLGVIVNLTLNLWLIPDLYAEGAAIATFATQALVMIGQLILAVKIFSLDIRYWFLIKTILFVTVSTILVTIIHSMESIPWVPSAIISVIITTLLSFLIGIVRKDMIFALIK